jgi:hypothetical protein
LSGSRSRVANALLTATARAATRETQRWAVVTP